MKRTMFMVWIAAVVLVGQPLASQTPGSTSLEIRTLSTRPDTVSGGDVLVQIAVPRNVAADRIAVTLNGRDVRAGREPALHQLACNAPRIVDGGDGGVDGDRSCPAHAMRAPRSASSARSTERWQCDSSSQ